MGLLEQLDEFRKAEAIWQNHCQSLCWQSEGRAMPDTFKFIFVIGLIAGCVYGAAYALASFPPEPSEIIKSLPHEKLRQH